MRNPSRSKVLYRWGVRRRGKTGNHRKVGVKKKWWVLVQFPYSQQGNGRQSPRVETTGIDYSTRRITQGAGIVKGWEEKRNLGRIPDAFK